MRGTIDVQAIYRRREDERRLRAWLARMDRLAQREEEAQVLREYHQASDKQEVVAHHRQVFDRIKANRQRAHRIEQEERRIVDAWMRAHGYVVRPKRAWPRYVRPGARGGHS